MGIEPQRLKVTTDYLLGQLSEQEREKFEAEYFTDNRVLIELLEIEDQLINSYLQGQLSPPERHHFEQFYLANPGKRQKMEFTNFLNQPETRKFILGKSKGAAQNDSSWLGSILYFMTNRPFAGPLAAVILIALAVAVLWPAQQYLSTQAPTGAAKMSSQSPSIQPTGNLTGSAEQQTVHLLLAPGSQRSGGAQPDIAYKEVGTKIIELKLKLVGYVYRKYQGRLQKRDEGIKEVESNNSLQPESSDNQNVVIWKLEAAKLPAGDYQVELKGVKSNGDVGDTNSYDFNVRDR
jgi:hypothetical protein